jgi:RNA polymerase II subunit A C-terminal domain phosphatase
MTLAHRPGLKGFLEAMSELYEMHVYTMGTRSYAESVCRVIDPHDKYFGGRILSRSETENQGAHFQNG